MLFKFQTGKDGKDGRDGKDGKDGSNGEKGENGRDGRDCDFSFFQQILEAWQNHGDGLAR